MAKMVQFTNPFDKDFSWTWDSDPYTFPAGQTVYMEDWKAVHFAKHLVDRELLQNGLMVNHQSRVELERKCLQMEGTKEVEEGRISMEIENSNREAEDGAEERIVKKAVKPRAVRKSKKVVEEEAKNESEEPKDEEFEGANEA